ncbi:MAG TPA: Snf7 family protein [Candidatus Nitrosocosmicus sp.]|jgi:division protein CdvB (Snf7/Vps24/ESCRT-III family)|nr:Snf7 family protein [Candidatus Nitrosocosmicus sp.]
MVFGDNKKWNNSARSESVRDKLREVAQSQTPLKPRIEEAQRKLQIQISKLDSISNKMQEKDKVIFSRIVNAMQNHDSHYAKVLSGELSQIRRTNKMVNSAKLAFEQIQLRLNTMTELGDIVVTLSPAMSVIKGIQGGLKTMLPEADQSFGQISDLLGGIMSGSSQMATAEIGTKELTFDEEAIKIIEEASAIVEEDTRDKFPDLPLSSPAERMQSSNNNGGRKETSMY